ncbi:MAG TPA: HEAT repeat domain-containing protein [Terriglobia bacterium]|nr:HEAT repeat domain-containing protein [Terriglobia bacterium]
MVASFPGLIHAVLILSWIVLAGIIALVAIVIGRRIKREAEFKTLDHFREHLHSVVDALANHTLEYDAGLAAIRALIPPRHAPAVEQILVEELESPTRAAMLQRLARDLGLIQAWQQRMASRNQEEGMARPGALRRLFGLRFTERAASAERLGRIRDLGSWRLLARALQDPHRDVQAVALRSLASIGEPQSFPVLVEQLRSIVTSHRPGLSARTLKAALARFPLDSAPHLLPLLEDRDSRLRVIAIEILREMLETNAGVHGKHVFQTDKIGPQLSRLALTQLANDENPDVRAGAADLLPYFTDERAAPALARLCSDPEWFVRLHAVRGLGENGEKYFLEAICARLSDPHWRVREAAARALARGGEAGVRWLIETFLTTGDAYAREQITEEFQTSGIMAEIVRRCERGAASAQELEALAAIVRMGKTSYLRTLQAETSGVNGWENIQALLARTFDAHA